MKKFRKGYEFTFLPKGGSFNYNNELIGAMSLGVVYKLFNVDGQETLFTESEANEYGLIHSEDGSYPINALLKVSFDRENILKFTPNKTLLDEANLQLQWEINYYDKDIGNGFLVGKESTEEEFMDIMKNNIERFDNPDNYPASSDSFFMKEIGPVN